MSNNNNEISFTIIESIAGDVQTNAGIKPEMVKLIFTLNSRDKPYIKITRFRDLYNLLNYCPTLKNKALSLFNKACGTRPFELSRGYKGTPARWSSPWLDILKDFLNTKINKTDGFINKLIKYLDETDDLEKINYTSMRINKNRRSAAQANSNIYSKKLRGHASNTKATTPKNNRATNRLVGILAQREENAATKHRHTHAAAMQLALQQKEAARQKTLNARMPRIGEQMQLIQAQTPSEPTPPSPFLDGRRSFVQTSISNLILDYASKKDDKKSDVLVSTKDLQSLLYNITFKSQGVLIKGNKDIDIMINLLHELHAAAKNPFDINKYKEVSITILEFLQLLASDQTNDHTRDRYERLEVLISSFKSYTFGGNKKKKPSKKLKKPSKKLKKLKKPIKKSTPKKHKGPRGGVYIIRKGKKIYQ